MTGTTLTWPRRSTFVDRERYDERGQAPTFSQGDEVTIEDDDRLQTYLDRGWVEGTADEVLDDEDDQQTGSSEPSVDPDVFVQAFTAQSAQDQADAIEAGEVDDYLDAIEQANSDGDDYATVQDAIDARRDEIGG